MIETVTDPRAAKAKLDSVFESVRSPSALGRNLWEQTAGSGGESSAVRRHMSTEEHWRGMAARILFSPSFRYYYCIMIAINLFALAFSFYEYHLAPHLLWFIALEFFLTVSLVLVCARAWTHACVCASVHA